MKMTFSHFSHNLSTDPTHMYDAGRLVANTPTTAATVPIFCALAHSISRRVDLVCLLDPPHQSPSAEQPRLGALSREEGVTALVGSS